MREVRVAWITHNPLFTGRIGGAEMADEAMISQAPNGVQVSVFHTTKLPEDLDTFDRVVVSGVDDLGADEIERLVELDPVSWLHHEQPRFALLRWLYERSKYVVALTPRHREIEEQWLPNAMFEINPGWFDTSECQSREKTHDVLFAHRNVWHKGLGQARAWAIDHGRDLTIMMDEPRSQVLNAMATHKAFILLSEIFDAGPRSVMEAQLSGCDIIVNENVGWYDEPASQLKRRIDGAGTHFWRLVCE